MIRARAAILAAAFSFLAAAPAPAQGAKKTLPGEVQDRLRKATVYIETSLTLAPQDWARLPEEIKSRAGRRPGGPSSGSGFIISPEGYVVTNAHVVEGMMMLVQAGRPGQQLPRTAKDIPINPEKPEEPFTMRFNPGAIKVVVESGEEAERVCSANVLRVDSNADLALLKISSPEPFEYLDLAEELEAEVGMPVIMTGFPGGKLPDAAPFINGGNAVELLSRHPKASINAGLVSAVREFRGDQRYQLDIRANHGNSGGPITNADGDLIGVLYAGIDEMQSINYAIPARYLTRVLSSALIAELGLDGGSGEDDAAAEPAESEAEAGSEAGEIEADPDAGQTEAAPESGQPKLAPDAGTEGAPGAAEVSEPKAAEPSKPKASGASQPDAPGDNK